MGAPSVNIILGLQMLCGHQELGHFIATTTMCCWLATRLCESRRCRTRRRHLLTRRSVFLGLAVSLHMCLDECVPGVHIYKPGCRRRPELGQDFRNVKANHGTCVESDVGTRIHETVVKI